MDEKTTNQGKNDLNEVKIFDDLEAISDFQIKPYNELDK